MSKYLDDLRAAAEAEFAAKKAAEPVIEPAAEVVEAQPEPVQPAEPVEPAQPAEPVEEPVVPEEPQPEPKPQPNRRTVYTKVIDLGDGSPPQVFKAATKDELIEKIITAQTNASKRINELKKQNRELQQKVQPDLATPDTKLEPKTLSAEEELEVANELQSNPSGAIAKLLRAAIGAGPEEIREALSISRELKQRESIREIGQQFIAAHPEYPISNENEKLMAQYIQTNKLAWTVKNLELAFSDLVEAGMIVLPGSQVEELEEEETGELPVAPQQEPVVPAAQPAAKPARTEPGLVEVPRRKKTVVGISSSQAVATAEPEAPREVSVEDLLKLPQAERRRIVMRQLGR